MSVWKGHLRSTAGRPSSRPVGVRWPHLAWQAVAGLLLGYFLLHPLSMVIFQSLDPRLAEHQGDGGHWWAPIFHSFHWEMQPMGLVFGVVGAGIAGTYGYWRLVVAFQRDRLAEELRRNELLRQQLAEQAERLRRSNRQLARLERANRRTTQFMAHDFKTALNCVGGFASQLLEKPSLRDDPEVARALAAIRRQAHRMMGSVTDLLEMARVREGGRPNRRTVSATQLLEEAVEDFSLPAVGGRLTVGPKHRSCPPLEADPQLLRRVLCNLISNALRHNGPRTCVTVDAELAASGAEILFRCRDDGQGVPEERLSEIFTEFATTGDSASGATGLGLAFCRSVVEAHGGRIWCENLPRGAQFLFTIPLKPGE
ncbi:MAG TPA: HAMP domain-containing histidine kinase [Planctomycetes bacterium]|nr:HAMP domain-containing histidine kinase [Planctomycetota bacterium]